ncbi:hypothetical protein QFC21_002594 [Naganishia friedmannii]|uniref:Uncharacterized protein n=1 Tax=Naganishia friedmannii TaxID=89922 RepID=A0ACC2VXM6_9TREE|nr:hypothetical protein QFC21_002594 [Naganishia friedmannii]
MASVSITPCSLRPKVRSDRNGLNQEMAKDRTRRATQAQNLQSTINCIRGEREAYRKEVAQVRVELKDLKEKDPDTVEKMWARHAKPVRIELIALKGRQVSQKRKTQDQEDFVHELEARLTPSRSARVKVALGPTTVVANLKEGKTKKVSKRKEENKDGKDGGKEEKNTKKVSGSKPSSSQSSSDDSATEYYDDSLDPPSTSASSGSNTSDYYAKTSKKVVKKKVVKKIRPSKNRLKPKSLPRFYGKKSDDVEDWLERVEAI